MSDAEPFLLALLESPADEAPRLILCDWLLDQGADDGLIEFVRSGNPWPDAVVKRVYGGQAWIMWASVTEWTGIAGRHVRHPFRWQPLYVVNSGGDPYGTLRAVVNAIRKPCSLDLPEVTAAVAVCRAEEIAKRVREWARELPPRRTRGPFEKAIGGFAR